MRVDRELAGKLAAATRDAAWDDTTDVIVIGGGLAGHCAALAAAAAGAQVWLIEKEPQIGGSTVLSSGYFAFAGTDLQAGAGIQDTNDALYQALREVGGQQNREDLVRAYADHQLEAYYWLRAQGVAFGDVVMSSGQSVARSHATLPREVIAALARKAQSHGAITTLTHCAAERLVRAGADQPVAGVILRTQRQLRSLRARKGVVLACGGFSMSEELLRLFAPNQAAALRYGGPGNTGDGIRMAWQLGAGLADMGYVKGTFGSHPEADHSRHWTQSILAVYRGAIAVNRQGSRFVDESVSYKLLGDAVLMQPAAVGYQIFDQTVMDRSSPGVALFDFQPALKLGLLVQADTFGELADRAGIARGALSATVDRYNGFVAAGRDADFGRSSLSSGGGALTKIERPPFYAFCSTSVVLATYCGLTVDPATRVLDVFGEPIAGLFAAGEMTGGFHGVAYMTGTSLGKCTVFGRIAGRNAAARGDP